jgi:NADH-quinone oxidoreductase subunit A
MTPMPTTLVYYLLVFLAVAIVFLFFHMLMGKAIRPNKPEADKLTIYECGEPTVGSAWVQFDLRYYVVALLFVVFDVEVAFFFPWATVFGTANQLRNEGLSSPARTELSARMLPSGMSRKSKEELNLATYSDDGVESVTPIDATAAGSWAWVAFFDIIVFFSVLMVGFAYLWRRGDIDWVRSVTNLPLSTGPPVGNEKS